MPSMETILQVEFYDDARLRTSGDSAELRQDAEVIERKNAWPAIFHEAAERPLYTQKDGPLASLIDVVLIDTTKKLREMHPGFVPAHLHPGGYLPTAQRNKKEELLQDAPASTKYAFKALSRTYRSALGNIGAGYADSHDEVELPLGTLAEPPFIGWKNSSKCSLFSFMMIAQGILGEEDHELVREREVLDALQRAPVERAHKVSHGVDFEVFAGALASRGFGKLSHKQVEYLQIRGATLSTIGKVATGIRQRRPEVEVFCTTPLQSDTYDSFWHQVVLVGEDEEGVRVHNPGGKDPKANQLLSRKEFYRKWSVCMNLAHLFITEPRT